MDAVVTTDLERVEYNQKCLSAKERVCMAECDIQNDRVRLNLQMGVQDFLYPFDGKPPRR